MRARFAFFCLPRALPRGLPRSLPSGVGPVVLAAVLMAPLAGVDARTCDGLGGGSAIRLRELPASVVRAIWLLTARRDAGEAPASPRAVLAARDAGDAVPRRSFVEAEPNPELTRLGPGRLDLPPPAC